MPSVIKERLLAGQIVRTMHITGFIKPRALEMFGLVGNFHGVWIDQEHSAIAHAEMENLLIACRASKLDAFARVATGFGSTPMATHVAQANRERWVAIQIETPESVEIVDQIAALEGVDWLFVGPADLSVTLGVAGEFLHPKCVEALKRVSAAVKKNGKAWGTLCRDPDHALRCRELGCQLFSIFGDIDCLRAGLTAIEQRFAALMD
jgi:2-dehydro-3-deoxyglucarate aldolase/4-hydroxy-2-oxoheptanedioate aldolase